MTSPDLPRFPGRHLAPRPPLRLAIVDWWLRGLQGYVPPFAPGCLECSATLRAGQRGDRSPYSCTRCGRRPARAAVRNLP